MAVIDDIRIRQDFRPDGYIFEKEAKEILDIPSFNGLIIRDTKHELGNCLEVLHKGKWRKVKGPSKRKISSKVYQWEYEFID